MQALQLGETELTLHGDPVILVRELNRKFDRSKEWVTWHSLL